MAPDGQQVSRVSGATVEVSASRPCPASVGVVVHVPRRPALAPHRLLPRTADAGRICEYLPGAQAGRSLLRHDIRLGPTGSARLARAVNGISLAVVAGQSGCPADFFGHETLIALAYPTGVTAELYYKTSGCRSLDNGSVQANEIANPSFYDGFMTVIASLVPRPAP